jgi:hypothetical protein
MFNIREWDSPVELEAHFFNHFQTSPFTCNVGKTIVGHPLKHQFCRWYKPFPHGWFITFFYPHLDPLISRLVP